MTFSLERILAPTNLLGTWFLHMLEQPIAFYYFKHNIGKYMQGYNFSPSPFTRLVNVKLT